MERSVTITPELLAEIEARARAYLDTKILALVARVRKIEERADIYKWQVRDTCTRAEKAEAERDALAAKLKVAEEALSAVLTACDKGRLAVRPGCGVGGMTIEANLKASVINGVSAWEVEEARAALSRFTAEPDEG